MIIAQPYLARKYPVRILYASTLDEIPLLYSALSIKYTGRLRFGFLHYNDSAPATDPLLGWPDRFVVSTRTWNSTYRQLGSDASYSYPAMNLVIMTLMPDANDLFMLTLILINFFSLTDLFLFVNRTFFQAFAHYLCITVSLNSAVILLWIPVSALLSCWPLYDLLISGGGVMLRSTVNSIGMVSLRQLMLLSETSNAQAYVICQHAVFCVIIGCLLYRYTNCLGDGTISEIQTLYSILNHQRVSRKEGTRRG